MWFFDGSIRGLQFFFWEKFATETSIDERICDVSHLEILKMTHLVGASKTRLGRTTPTGSLAFLKGYHNVADTHDHDIPVCAIVLYKINCGIMSYPPGEPFFHFFDDFK